MKPPKGCVTYAEFARICGVSAASVTRQRQKGPLKPAFHFSGDGIDPNHPAAIAYRDRSRRRKALEAQGRRGRMGRPPKKKAPPEPEQAPPEPEPEPAPPPKPTPKKPRAEFSAGGGQKKPRPPDPEIAENYWLGLPKDIRAMADMSLRRLCEIYGTDRDFSDWVRARHELEKAKERELKNLEREGKLVSREAVATHVLAPINSMHELLLRDASKAIASRAVSMVHSGRDELEIRRWIAEQIGQYIKRVKTRVARDLERIE